MKQETVTNSPGIHFSILRYGEDGVYPAIPFCDKNSYMTQLLWSANNYTGLRIAYVTKGIEKEAVHSEYILIGALCIPNIVIDDRLIEKISNFVTTVCECAGIQDVDVSSQGQVVVFEIPRIVFVSPGMTHFILFVIRSAFESGAQDPIDFLVQRSRSYTTEFGDREDVSEIVTRILSGSSSLSRYDELLEFTCYRYSDLPFVEKSLDFYGKELKIGDRLPERGAEPEEYIEMRKGKIEVYKRSDKDNDEERDKGPIDDGIYARLKRAADEMRKPTATYKERKGRPSPLEKKEYKLKI